MNSALQAIINRKKGNAPAETPAESDKVKAVVASLPQAAVEQVAEASEGDKVNPPESKEALGAAMGTEEPKVKPKGRGRGRPKKTETTAAPTGALEGSVEYAEVQEDCVRVALKVPVGSVVPVGATVVIGVKP